MSDKLNVVQHPVYTAVHVCKICNRIKLLTRWVPFDKTYITKNTYVVRTYCPECFKKVGAALDEQKQKKKEEKFRKKVLSKMKKKK